MKQNRKLLSKRYSREYMCHLKIPTNVQYTLRELEKEIERTPNYRIPFNHCQICGCKEATIVSEMSRFSLPMESQVCDFCGLVYTVGHFSLEFMHRYYKYYFYRIRRPGSKKKKFIGHIKPGSNAWARQHFVKQHIGKKYNDVKIVAEIGCGDGGNLYPYYCDNKRAIGCDFNEEAMQKGKEIGLELYNGDVSCLIKKGIKADLIILPHVLAHISDLNEFLGKISKLINPGGYLYVESDGIFSSSSNGEQKHNNLLRYFQFDFNFCFELRTLSYLLEKNGFTMEYGNESIKSIFTLQINNDYFIDSFAQIPKNNGEVLKKMERMEHNYLNQGILIRKLRGFINLIKNTAIYQIFDILIFLRYKKNYL